MLLGDILSDLPAVSNFEILERQRYASEPQRVTQARLGQGTARGEALLREALAPAPAPSALLPPTWPVAPPPTHPTTTTTTIPPVAHPPPPPRLPPPTPPHPTPTHPPPGLATAGPPPLDDAS